jgi:hypothetical protein
MSVDFYIILVLSSDLVKYVDLPNFDVNKYHYILF